MSKILNFRRCLYLFLCGILSTTPINAYEKATEDGACEQGRQPAFSWPFIEDCGMRPRGGVTTGVKVALDPAPHPGWLGLKEPGISDFEKDRRAILAMAGPYRTSFNFIEVAGYTPGFSPHTPYQSWGTEYVYVVEDKGDFISLQHIMVMYFEDDRFPGPMVMKHWRQDWQYEKPEILEYVGDNTWENKKLSAEVIKGGWSQSVYQVDDSPRYESYGRWEHKPNFSTWRSGKTWRPLPRREHTVRDDYQVLEGFNRHTIVPSGWVQEQENYKLVTDNPDLPYLAKELGINRYERIIDHDFTPGDQYWRNSGAYWRDVRMVWSNIFKKYETLTLHKQVKGQPLFMPLFSYAEKLKDEPYDSKKGKAFIENTINQYVKAPVL